MEADMLQSIPNSKVFHLPLAPRIRIRQLISKCPAWQAIADFLPDDTADRGEYERVLANALRHMLHPLRLSYDDAVAVLNECSSPQQLVSDEMEFLNPESSLRNLYEVWCRVWEAEDDATLRGFAMFCVSAMSRLYRR
jgi:hypothetical protein